jgi:glycine cleavage system H protein
MITGKPDAKCVDVHAYRAILDKTIDKILEKQKAEEIT